MKVYPQCIQCIIDVRLRDIRSIIAGSDEAIKRQLELLDAIREELARNSELTEVASRIFHRLARMVPGVVEYYRELKKRAIDGAWSMASRYRGLLEGLDGYDMFRVAVKISIAGNALDMGVAGHEPPEEIGVEAILSTPLTIDHTKEIYAMLRRGGNKVLWLFDNAGEAVMDTILMDVVRGMGNEVVGAAKEDPGFQNDLTISDAKYAGLDKHLNKLVSTGYAGSTIHLNKVSRELLWELEGADVIVAKGMAHFEYLHEVGLGKPVAYLLMPKCDVVASISGGARGTYVALLSKPKGAGPRSSAIATSTHP